MIKRNVKSVYLRSTSENGNITKNCGELKPAGLKITERYWQSNCGVCGVSLFFVAIITHIKIYIQKCVKLRLHQLKLTMSVRKRSRKMCA